MENDSISRSAALDAIDEQIEQCGKALSSFDISMKDEYAVKVERASLVAFRETLEYLPSAQPETEERTAESAQNVQNGELISKKAAIDALKRAEALTRAFGYHCVIDTIQELSSAQPEIRSVAQTFKGYSIDQLIMIANVLERENLPPERVAEALTDMRRVIAMAQSEFKESLRQSVKWFMEDENDNDIH